MFYNSKKLIEEKVLQQYYFERFMLASGAQRKELLPPQYAEYSKTRSVKVLHPEVNLGNMSNGNRHITDFVFYPMEGRSRRKLNIEVKWDVRDFLKPNQRPRYPFYDGTRGHGFLVAVRRAAEDPTEINTEGSRSIPVVYLDAERFKQWFSVHSFEIVSQALSNKLDIPPARLTGIKYWVVYIASGESMVHYMEHGRPRGIWAFRDAKNPQNIIKILNGDYVVFVHLARCRGGRRIYPYYQRPTILRGPRGNEFNNTEVEWDIGHLDIFKVSKGYHLNFSAQSPYEGFEEETWIASENHLPEKKCYTQFIRFGRNADDPYQHHWERDASFTLPHTLFSADDESLCGFVSALSKTANSQGDAIEISRSSFEALARLLN